MFKLIAIDLDGTMLNSYGIVEEETKLAIKKAKEKGVEVIIASGRPIDSIKTIAKEIESNKYFIAVNGSLIYDIQKEELIYEKHLKKEKVLEIINICEENSISYNVYTDKSILATSLKYNVLYYYKENLKKSEDKKTHINIVNNMKEYIKELEDTKFFKITICDEDLSVFNSIMKKLKEISGIEVLDISHMSRKTFFQGTEEIEVGYHYTEISMKDVDKWYAIEYLIDKLGIRKEEVITIGDNINDKIMIENAGVGVAMKGSTPIVTEVSNYITMTNNENGVGIAIKDILGI